MIYQVEMFRIPACFSKSGIRYICQPDFKISNFFRFTKCGFLLTHYIFLMFPYNKIILNFIKSLHFLTVFT